MNYILPAAVFILMVSVGMSLKPGEIAANWKQFSLSVWVRVLAATFIIPPLIALVAAKLFDLSLAETAGLFLVGVSPGAPLLTRNMAKKGFDMHKAASYQLLAAFLIPMMIPLLVSATGRLYHRDIWIPPGALVLQIAENQFLPLAIGVTLTLLFPLRVKHVQPVLNSIGNATLMAMILLILIKTGSSVKNVSLLVPPAALLLAVGSIAIMNMVNFKDMLVKQTFSLCNANRHVGLAILLSGQYLHAQKALPAVACYAIISPLVMFAYIKLYPTQQ